MKSEERRDASIKKAPLWFTASGLQLPHAVQTIIDAKVSVPQNSKSVKSDFSLKDSLGNILTEAQAEYFKDSKGRDEKGNLLVVYHGTFEDFTIFDISKGEAISTKTRPIFTK